jgi:hypothetical protein
LEHCQEDELNLQQEPPDHGSDICGLKNDQATVKGAVAQDNHSSF